METNLTELRPDPTHVLKTRFFADCLGVFEGGGCRGAAFAGAYEEAYRRGIRFSAVAGSSSGSIVAALVAAGAKPDDLLRIVTSTDFRSLLRKPTRSTFRTRPLTIRLLKPAASITAIVMPRIQKYLPILQAADFGGLYSGDALEEWFDEQLRKLTGKSHRVQFRDLRMPLFVVATDLALAGPRIWSPGSPDVFVAHAVRASCSLPLVFQPVEEGSALLFDGGLVSNAPAFVFSDPSLSNRDQTKSTLVFTLRSAPNQGRPANALEMFAELASIAIDGTTGIQLGLSDNTAVVEIQTGDVKATDFERVSTSPETVTQLVSSGRAAVSAFVEGEVSNPTKHRPANRYLADLHELFLSVIIHAEAAKHEVVISMRDTEWAWDLFPSVYAWRRRGLRVACVVPPLAAAVDSASAKERQRRNMLVGLGVEMRESDGVPFYGFLIDGWQQSSSSAVILRREPRASEPIAQVLSGRVDSEILEALKTCLAVPSPESMPLPPPSAPLKMEDTELLVRLRAGVHFYRPQSVTLTLEEVPLDQVWVISRYTRSYRYRQIGILFDEFQNAGLGSFQAASIRLSDGSHSIVTPPVFELIANHRYVAVEGNTRCTYCRRSGVKSIFGVVVRNVAARLPGTPVPLDHVLLTSRRLLPTERMDGFSYEFFREIERAVRPIS